MADQLPVVAHWVGEYLELTESFIYQYLANLRAVRAIVLAGRIKDDLGAFHIPHLHSMYGKRWTWPWAWSYTREILLRRFPEGPILHSHRASLIHAHYGDVGCQALRARARLGLPLVTTFYGWDMSGLARQRSWQAKYHRLFATGDLFLVEGPYMRDRLIELGAPAGRVQIQRIAIDMQPFQSVLRAPPVEGPIRLLLCGRFTEKKGIPYAVEAMSLLREAPHHFELRVIGDGDLRPQIEEQIRALHLENTVNLLGYRNYQQYAEELRQAHILLCPSVTARDGDSEGGAPTVLLEAQASGLPVVATRHADIPNVVREGESALLVPERDPAALAEALLQLANKPDSWGPMGEAGRSWIKEAHNIYVEVRRLEEKYYQLLGLPPADGERWFVEPDSHRQGTREQNMWRPVDAGFPFWASRWFWSRERAQKTNVIFWNLEI